MVQDKSNQIDQWNRIENPEVDPTYSHDFQQMHQNPMGEKKTFSTNSVGITRYLYWKILELTPNLPSLTQSDLQYNTDINTKAKTIKAL